MDPISQLQQDIERYDADAVYYIGRAEHCRREAALLRQELAREQACERLEKAHSMADTILGLEAPVAVKRLNAQYAVTDAPSPNSSGFVPSPSIISTRFKEIDRFHRA